MICHTATRHIPILMLWYAPLCVVLCQFRAPWHTLALTYLASITTGKTVPACLPLAASNFTSSRAVWPVSHIVGEFRDLAFFQDFSTSATIEGLYHENCPAYTSQLDSARAHSGGATGGVDLCCGRGRWTLKQGLGEVRDKAWFVMINQCMWIRWDEMRWDEMRRDESIKYQLY